MPEKPVTWTWLKTFLSIFILNLILLFLSIIFKYVINKFWKKIFLYLIKIIIYFNSTITFMKPIFERIFYKIFFFLFFYRYGCPEIFIIASACVWFPDGLIFFFNFFIWEENLVKKTLKILLKKYFNFNQKQYFGVRWLKSDA